MSLARVDPDNGDSAKTLIVVGALMTAIGVPLTVIGGLWKTCRTGYNAYLTPSSYPCYGVQYSGDSGVVPGATAAFYLGFGVPPLIVGVPMILAGIVRISGYPSQPKKPVALHWNIVPYATASSSGLVVGGRF
jgi:hypothetical protein